MQHASPILTIQNLTKRFGGLAAVNDCSFSVAANSITGLIGPNGAGKTTTYDLITGILEPTAGTIYFRDEDITRLPAWKRARRGLARTFQLVRLFPELTAIDNLLIVLQKNHQQIHHIFTASRAELRRLHDEAMELLKRVNIDHLAHTYAKNLSYGQQKLLEITRALATHADLLLLDEPAAGVNPTMLRTIEKVIHDLHAEGKTILVVEHNMPFVMTNCETIIVMDQGSQILTGTPREVQSSPRVLEAYLGKKHPTLHAK